MRRYTRLIGSCVLLVLLYLVVNHVLTTRPAESIEAVSGGLDIGWYSPSPSWITELDAGIAEGLYGFRFGGHEPEVPGQYSYCNMEHVHPETYAIPSKDEYELKYVEVVHRHHRRTPYAHNGFPEEATPWNCPQEALFYAGRTVNPVSVPSSNTYWSIVAAENNPFLPKGFHGSCKFPQLTRWGLEDSWQHGKDLSLVYRDMLHLLPEDLTDKVSFSVTNNIITSQVASTLIPGMFSNSDNHVVALKLQPEGVDSLEPQYSCPPADKLTANSILGNNPTWKAHMKAVKKVYQELDAVSGVAPSDEDFHRSIDHYFDNLSSRACHDKPLPCKIGDGGKCIKQELADTVYRIGQWEYSWQHRGSPHSLTAAVGAYGVWFSDLVQHLRDAAIGSNMLKYRHNVAHDGSIARILSILQIDTMVWPGMGAEVVFELYKRKNYVDKYALRILWGGRVFKSSSPTLGLVDMIDLDIFTGYIDGLIGLRAVKVHQYCSR